MEAFQIIPPSIALATYVKHYWILEADEYSLTPQRIIPKGTIELVFHRGNKLWSPLNQQKQADAFVCGQYTGYTDLVPTGSVNMVVVTFLPHAAGAFFAMPMNEINGRNVSTDDLSDVLLRELADRIGNTRDNRTCIQLIEQFLQKRLHPFKEYNHKRMTAAIQVINQRVQIDMATLADTVCLGYKQFKRVFAEHVGANPKDFLRVVRFQRALYVLQTQPGIDLTELALECGYYDQPHLINEFKAFSGYTPREYIAVCAPYSDYFL